MNMPRLYIVPESMPFLVRVRAIATSVEAANQLMTQTPGLAVIEESDTGIVFMADAHDLGVALSKTVGNY